MGILSWFDTREVDALADSMVQELVKRVPPARLEAKDARTAKQLRYTHEAVFLRAQRFVRENRLNLFKKARLGNQFRWGLKDAGYPPEFVDSWTQELVTLVAVNRGGPVRPDR